MGTRCDVHDKFLEAIEKYDNWDDVQKFIKV